ncbi:MAG: amidohydrolase family protein [Longimicrobiales bacterium]
MNRSGIRGKLHLHGGASLVLLLLGAVISGATAQTAADADSTRADGSDLPLEPTATIEFSTDEATWLSLDVTPDGRTIVFELLGDLYTLPLEGGTATRLTSGLAFDAQPRVSPDGRWIAFISDRDGADNLWVAAIDGSEPRKLSSETQNALISPVWTPDSRYVVVTRRARDIELRMYHIDGGSGLTLKAAADPQPEGVGASFGPDGRHLYFARRTGTGGTFPNWQVARFDTQTGQVDDLTQAEWGAVRPLVSPDGRLLVYGTRHETETGLRVRDLVTGDDRWLIWPVQRDEQETAQPPSRDFLPGYAFTPDGRELVTTFDGRIQAVDLASGRARVIPFRAAVRLDAGPDLAFTYRLDDGPVRARLVQSPQISPDGRRIAFSVLARVYVLDLAGAQPRRLTAEQDWEFQPAWSPDGQWLAYVTWSADGGHIWRMRADGRGGPQRVSQHAAFYTDLAFSPDGARIVALRGNAFLRNQTFSEFGGLRIPLDLVWLPASGGEARVIAPARGVGRPHFADDPDRVYVYTRDGLASMRFDGSDRRIHLEVTGRQLPGAAEPPRADEALMRPDGEWALASSANQLYVIAVPRIGGEAPSVSVTGGGVPVKRITDIGADYFGWADAGATVFWAIGSTVFRLPFDSIAFRAADDEPTADAAERSDTTATDAAAADTADTPLDYSEHVERTEIRLEFPRAVPRGTIVLRHATAITMRGEEVIEDADIVVTDNRIAAIGASGSLEIPADARELDLSGSYIVPGFIDTHAHWEFRTHDVLEPHNWSLLANLAYGVTAGLDVQTSTNDYFAYQDLVEIGAAIGQRAFMTGPGVFLRSDFKSYSEVESFLRRYKEHYRTANIKSYMVGNREQRQWVVQAARELGLMPTTEGGRNLKLDLTHAIDGFHGNEHTLPVVPLYDDVVQLFARSRTAYTPTLLVLYGGPAAREWFFTREEVHDDAKLNRFYPHNWLDELTRRRRSWVRADEHTFAAAAAQAAKIKRAGGLVGVGGHGELQGLGYHWEMWALAMGGMTPREVLEAATIDGAHIIGFAPDLGSLEPGKLADLVVLDRNPLDDIRNTTAIRLVMKDGALYEDETLRQIWPVERELPRLWWWGNEPERRVGATRRR